jgi:hypothetical protein
MGITEGDKPLQTLAGTMRASSASLTDIKHSEHPFPNASILPCVKSVWSLDCTPYGAENRTQQQHTFIKRLQQAISPVTKTGLLIPLLISKESS